ncbi:MAG TPA: hypothetical protein VG938_20640 [Verrucomicrobiae bacterium]|nr:hypothetical protein [Verrucomicrobiae bacterium]
MFDCSTAVATLTVIPTTAFSMSEPSGTGVRSLKQISYSALAGQIDTFFRVRLSPLQTVELKLLKAPLAPSTPVMPGRGLPGDAGHEKFSLIFSGPREKLIAPAIYRFEQEKLGEFDMYIGQIGSRDMDFIRYETVFNRPTTTAATLSCENRTNQKR